MIYSIIEGLISSSTKTDSIMESSRQRNKSVGFNLSFIKYTNSKKFEFKLEINKHTLSDNQIEHLKNLNFEQLNFDSLLSLNQIFYLRFLNAIRLLIEFEGKI